MKRKKAMTSAGKAEIIAFLYGKATIYIAIKYPVSRQCSGTIPYNSKTKAVSPAPRIAAVPRRTIQ